MKIVGYSPNLKVAYPVLGPPRGKNRSKIESIFLCQEDLNSENVPFSCFPWLAPLLGSSRGHEYLQRIL